MDVLGFERWVGDGWCQDICLGLEGSNFYPRLEEVGKSGGAGRVGSSGKGFFEGEDSGLQIG